jgi:hypothetical protein
MERPIDPSLIAPCGANCAVCMAFLRTERHCPGCRAVSRTKSQACITCRMKNCVELKKGGLTYCCECSKFPCARVRHIDKRYRTRYGSSMIDNLRTIKEQGIKSLLLQQKKKYTCTACGGTICIHRGYCMACKKVRYTHAGTEKAQEILKRNQRDSAPRGG